MWPMTKLELKKIWRGKLPIYLFLGFVLLLFINHSAHSWSAYLVGKLGWITLIMGMMGFGVLNSWVFGREYQDETFKDLLALPISRNQIVGAKLIALISAEVALTLACAGWTVLMGKTLLQFGDLPKSGLASLFGHFALAMLVDMALACLYPLLASLSRGLLTPICAAFAVLLIGRLMAGTPSGHYFPWAVPLLAMGQFNSLNVVSWLLVLMVGVVSVLGTMYWWTYQDHTD